MPAIFSLNFLALSCRLRFSPECFEDTPLASSFRRFRCRQLSLPPPLLPLIIFFDYFAPFSLAFAFADAGHYCQAFAIAADADYYYYFLSPPRFIDIFAFGCRFRYF